MVLDCGEGTYGQLVRFFGSEVDDVLTKIKGIYVSHLHADHHLGLISILQHRALAFEVKNIPFTPAYLIAPHQIQSWLYLYHKNFEKLKHLYELVAATSLAYSNGSLEPEFKKSFYDSLNMEIIETVGVRHCPNAYGVAITGKEGWKITYSGDTMPCDFLVTLGQGSDLLIHEATMEDELKEEAELKMHSTTSEAIDIGKKMNAKFILLTHFSQRYSKVPKINGELDVNVGIAFDNMRVSLSDLPKLPMMYPVLKTMFAESYEEMENKTAKKQMRKEREKQRALQP
jgi:ribonuclease Z